jgi:uncharacterized protein (TIGR04255 family)
MTEAPKPLSRRDGRIGTNARSCSAKTLEGSTAGFYALILTVAPAARHMLASKMTRRPADLPDFRAPPVTEVVLGVQFNTLDRFLSPHLGLVWDRFRSQFPLVEEQPPLAPVFETFGPYPQFMPTIGIQIGAGAPMPRVFFINPDRTQLLQIQRDRFLHNWRKVGEGDSYPRFERMLANFRTGLQALVEVITEAGLGAVVPNQCEVSYINQICVPEGGDVFGVIESLFNQQAAQFALNDLGRPEDLRFLLRYVIRDSSDVPTGRLIVVAEPALRPDGAAVIQLTLTARGKPVSADLEGAMDFLERGRIHVVRTFTELTSDTMHRSWERTQ